MTKPSKTRKTFTRNTFAEHNYNYVHQSKTNQPLQKNTQNSNHVCSHYWNFPNTSTNSVNFPDNPHPPQDYSENYPFFQQNKNKRQKPYNTKYLSSDDDDYYKPDIFAPYTKEYCTQRPRQSQPSQNMVNLPTKSNRYTESKTNACTKPISRTIFSSYTNTKPNVNAFLPTNSNAKRITASILSSAT